MTRPSAGKSSVLGQPPGFTLLEVLVALVVLGFLMAGLTQGLRFGVQSWDRQDRALAGRGNIEAADRALRRLIVAADPGSDNVPTRFEGNAATLAFTADLGLAAEALDTRVADLRLFAQGGRLLLRWTPHRHASLIAPGPAPAEVELLPGVERLEIAYWGVREGAAATWHAEWHGDTLPRLVRLRVVLAGPDGSRWPDIVVAPMRHRGVR